MNGKARQVLLLTGRELSYDRCRITVKVASMMIEEGTETNLYYHPEHYDMRYADYVNDVAFWLALAKESHGDVLELGVGTGRIALELLEAGHRVDGLDCSELMLQALSEKLKVRRLSATLTTGDFSNFELHRKYRLVIFPCSSICHILERESLLNCFNSVKRHLEAGGVFCFDLLVPDSRKLAGSGGKYLPRFAYENEKLGHVSVSALVEYDKHSQVILERMAYTINGRYEGETVRRSRMYFPLEMDTLVRGSGFTIVAKYGDFSYAPFEKGSRHQVFVLKVA